MKKSDWPIQSQGLWQGCVWRGAGYNKDWDLGPWKPHQGKHNDGH